MKQKILNALGQNGSPRPVFETDPERLSFCTTLLIHPYFLQQDESRNGIANDTRETVNETVKETVNETVNGTVKETVNETVNGTAAATEKERQILELLSQDPAYTYQEIANRLNIGRKAVFERIKGLKEKGLLERVGSDKSGYWKINM